MQVFQLIDKLPTYNLFTVCDLFITNILSLMHDNRSGMELITASDIVLKRTNYPFYNQNILEAQVLYIDQYENVVLNVKKDYFEEVRSNRPFKVLFMRDEEINEISLHYNDVPEGEKLCLFNTADYLEIAINKGHAAVYLVFRKKMIEVYFIIISKYFSND